jgi:hypothetical protein
MEYSQTRESALPLAINAAIMKNSILNCFGRR